MVFNTLNTESRVTRGKGSVNVIVGERGFLGATHFSR